MQSANLSGPLKGLRPYLALIGPTQASGSAGGFDYRWKSSLHGADVPEVSVGIKSGEIRLESDRIGCSLPSLSLDPASLFFPSSQRTAACV